MKICECGKPTNNPQDKLCWECWLIKHEEVKATPAQVKRQMKAWFKEYEFLPEL